MIRTAAICALMGTQTNPVRCPARRVCQLSVMVTIEIPYAFAQKERADFLAGARASDSQTTAISRE